MLSYFVSKGRDKETAYRRNFHYNFVEDLQNGYFFKVNREQYKIGLRDQK